MSRIIDRHNNFKFWFRGKQSMQCAKRPLGNCLIRLLYTVHSQEKLLLIIRHWNESKLLVILSCFFILCIHKKPHDANVSRNDHSS